MKFYVYGSKEHTLNPSESLEWYFVEIIYLLVFFSNIIDLTDIIFQFLNSKNQSLW